MERFCTLIFCRSSSCYIISGIKAENRKNDALQHAETACSLALPGKPSINRERFVDPIFPGWRVLKWIQMHLKV